MTESTQSTSAAKAHAHMLLAEEVRAYLVTVRGGAPFLSAADGRLLIEWLDQGIPIAVVLSAIERTAHRRANKRRRTRLSLGACKGEVKKLFQLQTNPPAAPAGGASSAKPAAASVLDREADRIAGLQVPDQATHARTTLVAALRALAVRSTPASDVSAEVASAVRAFHETLWAETSELQSAFRRQATEALAPLESVVSAKVFADLVDEHVRQAVRKLVPGVEVGPLWAQLGTGASA